MIKILIADDQELIRQSLSIILGNETDFEVTDTVSNGVEVVRSVRKNKPDVILMDIRMPEMDGVVCTQIIKENYPNIKIIILTTFDDDEYVFNALKNGASGYLLKGVSMKELAEAVRKVHEGTAMINGDIASKVVKLFSQMAQSNITIRVDESSVADLKETEWRITALVGSGMSNKEIAAKLNLSEGTVRNGLSTILGKLALRDRTQLAIWAVQTGAVNRVFGDERCRRGQNGKEIHKVFFCRGRAFAGCACAYGKWQEERNRTGRCDNGGGIFRQLLGSAERIFLSDFGGCHSFV